MSSELTIFFTPKAIDDLESVFEYSYNAWGWYQAERYHDDLYNAIQELRHIPDLGRLHQGAIQMY